METSKHVIPGEKKAPTVGDVRYRVTTPEGHDFPAKSKKAALQLVSAFLGNRKPGEIVIIRDVYVFAGIRDGRMWASTHIGMIDADGDCEMTSI